MTETTPICPGALWTPEAVSGRKAELSSAPSRSPLARPDRHGKHKASDTVEYRLIFTVAFVIFLFASAIERLLSSPAGLESAASKSIFQKAREAASISAGYAFMG